MEVVAGDLGDEGVAARAPEGVEVAYYLVHSMAGGQAFREHDRTIARRFGEAAQDAGVGRIVYLGGLGDPAEVTSKHLVSRHEVGQVLRSSGVPVAELRAAVIVGSGSASFEMLRHLTDRLPFMVAPRWVETRCQPIGVRSVLEYLVEALDRPGADGVHEIGGPDVLTYREMMLAYAQVRGLRRTIVSAPVPHPEWSGRFVDLVTPIPYAIAGPLVESLQTEVVVRDDRARETFDVRPMGYHEALELALARVATDLGVEPRQPEPRSPARPAPGRARRHVLRAPPGAGARAGRAGVRRHLRPGRRRGLAGRELALAAARPARPNRRWGRDAPRSPPPARAARRRGAGLLAGRGAGARPPAAAAGRDAAAGDGVAPVRGPARPEGARVEQTAFFDPRGVPGYLYWYAVLPFHRIVFPGLIRAVRERAEAGILKRRLFVVSAPAGLDPSAVRHTRGRPNGTVQPDAVGG